MTRTQRMHSKEGSAAIECVAMAPAIALLVLVIVQIAALFTQSVADVVRAEAAAARAILEWDEAHEGKGFHRPCLEEMPLRRVRYGGAPMMVGAGIWRRDVGVPQEVALVEEPVCIR